MADAIVITERDKKSYIAKSTDIVSGSVIPGARWIGAEVYVSDTGEKYVVQSDLSIARKYEQTDSRSDLSSSAKNLTLTLAGGIGQAAIADSSHLLGVYPVSASCVIGFSYPLTSGSASASAVAANYGNGIDVEATEWTWFNVGSGTSRTLYFSGSGTNQIKIAQL